MKDDAHLAPSSPTPGSVGDKNRVPTFGPDPMFLINHVNDRTERLSLDDKVKDHQPLEQRCNCSRTHPWEAYILPQTSLGPFVVPSKRGQEPVSQAGTKLYTF